MDGGMDERITGVYMYIYVIALILGLTFQYMYPRNDLKVVHTYFRS